MSSNHTTGLRGIRLFNELTQEKQGFTSALCPGKKGRSTDLIERRNKCLMHRFYFYSRIKNLKYEDIITILSEEFFLAERTVVDVITRQAESMRESFKEKKTIKQLQQLYVFLNWKN